MSMMISTSTPAAVPAASTELAQAAPAAPVLAVPGAVPVTAFADWMGLELAAVPQEAAGPAEGLPAELLIGVDGAPVEAVEGSDASAEGGEEPQEQAPQLAEELPALAAMMPAMPVHIPMAPLTVVPTALRAAAAAPANTAAASALPVDAAPAAPQPAMPVTAAPAFAAPAPTAAAAPVASAAPAIATDAPPAFDAPAPVAANGIAPSQPALAASTELKLAATPAAWQQPLREALGERLQLQLSRNIDQAVIRLDPPNLGRIEIAIRHMGGSLEVNISATHSEVVRQLHTISDTMRTDLAQRQFTEVAVNVTTATRSAAGSQQSFDQQGRQRQQGGGAEESDPGRALAEAGNPSSTFSLNGRESYA